MHGAKHPDRYLPRPAGCREPNPMNLASAARASGATAQDPATGAPDRNETWDLEHLAGARRLCDWMFSQFANDIGGDVVEVGAGIGTFSERILARGVNSLLLIANPTTGPPTRTTQAPMSQPMSTNTTPIGP